MKIKVGQGEGLLNKQKTYPSFVLQIIAAEGSTLFLT
jgi:hypothetical protein